MILFLENVFENKDDKISKSCMLLNGILVWFDYGNKQKDDLLPSVMEMIVSLPLSYLDVMRAYVELMQMGIITYDKNRGWVVIKSDYVSFMKVLVLLNNMTPYKKVLVEAMTKRFGDKAILETLVFNNDIEEFKRILLERHPEYHKIAVIPYFIDDLPFPSELEKIIPKRKLFRIDEVLKENYGSLIAIYNSLQDDIYQALVDMFTRLASYPLILLVMEQNTFFAQQFMVAFKKFIKLFSLDYIVVDNIKDCGLTRGEIFIFSLDKHAAENLAYICCNGWKYNFTRHSLPSRLRKSNFVVYNGIATFSDDYEAMGYFLADCILE